MSHESKKTTDHEQIRRWVDAREGWPATVKGTTGKDQSPGVLRIGFTQGKEGSLERISWETFFEKFEQQRLAFLCQDQTQSGEISRFFKFVRRD
ncbi:hypothetical protein [Methylomagnum sp.]